MDYSKLKGLMREKGVTQAELAKKIGMAESTLNLKLSGKTDFKTDEIIAISDFLGTRDAIEKYFFCQKTLKN